MFLVFNVKVLFYFCINNVICVGTSHGIYASGVGACVPRYDTLIYLFVLLEDTLFVLGDAPFTIRFCMVVRGLLIPLLWK